MGTAAKVMLWHLEHVELPLSTCCAAYSRSAQKLCNLLRLMHLLHTDSHRTPCYICLLECFIPSDRLSIIPDAVVHAVLTGQGRLGEAAAHIPCVHKGGREAGLEQES